MKKVNKEDSPEMKTLKGLLCSDTNKNTFGVNLDPSFFENPIDNKYLKFRPVRGGTKVSQYLTVSQLYNAYCLCIGKDLPSDNGWGYGKEGMFPAVNLSAIDAIMFANWLSMVIGSPAPYILVDIKGTWWIWKNPEIENSGVPCVQLLTVQDFKDATEEVNPVTGKNFIYAGSDDIGKVAWYSQNSGGRLHEVGQLMANGHGLFDCSGNAFDMTLKEEPPYMTPEKWKEYFGNRPYLKFVAYSADLNDLKI